MTSEVKLPEWRSCQRGDGCYSSPRGVRFPASGHPGLGLGGDFVVVVEVADDVGLVHFLDLVLGVAEEAG